MGDLREDWEERDWWSLALMLEEFLRMLPLPTEEVLSLREKMPIVEIGEGWGGG